MTLGTEHPTREQLDAGLEDIRRSPSDAGPLLMIVRRPGVDEREVVDEAELNTNVGLVGDNWQARGSPKTPDGKANPEAQITLMNSRALTLMAGSEERWPLAGDQLVIDLNMSVENMPPGARLAIGSAIVEITAKPHTGCEKFSDRFGLDSLQFVSSPTGRDLRLRGVNCRVVQAGTIRVGDLATKVLP